MATRKAPALVLESIEDMLSFNTIKDLPTDTGVLNEIELEKLAPYPNHKYRLYTGERLNDMVDSVRENGVLLPIIVWHTGEQNIILSGHNRTNAARIAGLTKIPCIIKSDLSETDAAAIVHETNLVQRSFSDLLHSEKAYCLVQHYENMKSQGKRNDKISEIEKLIISQKNPHDLNEKSTSSQIETKLRSDEKIGGEYGLSRATIARYIRLGTSLSPSLFELLDKEALAFNAAYLVSFLQQSDQDTLADLVDAEGYKLDLKKAEALKHCNADGRLTDLRIIQILSGDKKEKNKPSAFKLNTNIISRFFDKSQSQKEIEKVVEEALEQYFSGAC